MNKPLLAGFALALLAPGLTPCSVLAKRPRRPAQCEPTPRPELRDKVWNTNNFEIEAGQEAQNKANIQNISTMLG
ncbi:MAG: hypothetical protein U1E25_12820 [Methylocystis sp.]